MRLISLKIHRSLAFNFASYWALVRPTRLLATYVCRCTSNPSTSNGVNRHRDASGLNH
jgi:hypothetical protein